MDLDDLRRSLATLPKDPIAPENRNLARLHPSPWVPRATVYRLAPQPAFTGHHRPIIVMHPDDIALLREPYAAGRQWGQFDVGMADQAIADCCEQIFAEMEARGER